MTIFSKINLQGNEILKFIFFPPGGPVPRILSQGLGVLISQPRELLLRQEEDR